MDAMRRVIVSMGSVALAGMMALAPPAAGQDGSGYWSSGPQVVDSLALDQVVERALRSSPQMVQAETGVQSAVMGTRQAYASFLPNLSVSGGASLSSSERFDPSTGLRVSGQTDSYSAGMSSNIDLFSGGRNVAGVRSAQASEDAAEASLVTRRFSVAVTAKRAFYSVLRAGDLIKITEDRIGQAEENMEAAERRLSAGRATRSDVLRAELQLRNARQAKLEATTQHRTAMFALGQVVGASGPVAARRPESLAPTPLALSPDRLREMVLAEAPAVLAADAGMDVASAGLSQARSQYMPSIGLRAGYNWVNTDLQLAHGRTSWSTSLGISFPVFNRLQREVSVDRANAQLIVARAQADDARRSALAELERLLAGLQLAEERLALLEGSVEVATEDYRVQQARYEHGTTTILELLSSQIALTQAENDLVNARYDYQIARAELESLVGREL